MNGLWAAAVLAVFLLVQGLALGEGVSWDRVEGVAVAHQLAAAEGALHQGEAVGRIPLYGPLWYRIVAFLGGDAEGMLRAGRILSILSCLALVAMAFGHLRRLGVDAGRAALAATAWLGWGPALQFGGTDRCDAPALALAASGWMLGIGAGRTRAWWGGVLGGLSSLLRPTSGPEVLAWGLAAAWSATPGRWSWWVAGAGAGGIVAAATWWGLDGKAGWDHLLLAGAAGPDLSQAVDLLLRLAPQALPVVAVGLLLGAARATTIPVWVALGLGGLLLLRPGASVNWLLGPSWLLSLSLGAGLARIPAFVVPVLVVQTFLVQVPVVAQRLEQARGAEARSALVRSSPLPVLTSEPWVVLRAGRQPVLEDPHLVESLGRHGALPSGIVFDALRSGRWAVLPDPDLLRPEPRFWSPSTAAWVRDSMVACHRDDPLSLRVPSGVPCP